MLSEDGGWEGVRSCLMVDLVWKGGLADGGRGEEGEEENNSEVNLLKHNINIIPFTNETIIDQ